MSGKPIMPAMGEYAPWFYARALGGADRFAFSSIAGRHVLMLFCGHAGTPAAQQALALVQSNRTLFDDKTACFFGVTVDPSDEADGRIAQKLPGVRHFLDYDGAISKAYGALSNDAASYEAHWLVLDRELRIRSRYRIDDGERAIADLRTRLAAVEEGWAPVIVVPDVFEPSLCADLIALYESRGGEPSGFMRDVDGKTTLVVDDSFKQRRDCLIEDQTLKDRLSGRIARRLIPAMERAFQFRATRIARYLVACYEAGAGHFRPHRDNTTHGTAHRRFAVTINLNAGEYDGGDLRFPEFGQRTYRAPTGGAVVFSCSLLHEATPVTSGRRYAFLPFLYDEAARKVRDANLDKLAAHQAQTAG